jgi:hypothetical protein
MQEMMIVFGTVKSPAAPQRRSEDRNQRWARKSSQVFEGISTLQIVLCYNPSAFGVRFGGCEGHRDFILRERSRWSRHFLHV